MIRHVLLVLALVCYVTTDDADRLYDGREVLANAMAAAAIWEGRLAADSRDYESAWRLARACYWLGTHVAPDDRRQQLERGVTAARRAVSINSADPAGHFWLAATLGAMAEAGGWRAGLRYRSEIKRELEIVLKAHPSFQKGSADRALGRWYFLVPGLFGGSNQKSLDHLRRSLTYDPDNAASWSFLADTLRDMKKHDEVRQALQRVLAAPIDVEWGPETREFQRQAAVALKQLR